MRTGRPKAELVLSAEQRDELERWVRRRSTAQALALRARIIVSCAAGGNNIEVASRLGISRLTVGRWRSRFLRSGVDGLLDEPRPGAPRTSIQVNMSDRVPVRPSCIRYLLAD